MKLNILCIVFGATMVSTAFVLPASWVAFPVWLGAIGLVNGVFGLCYQRFIYQGDLMSKPDPLPFERSSRCPKCEHYISSTDVQYTKKNMLQLKCTACKYKFTMRPADHKERDRY